jgi:hypothetical protein
LALRHELAGWLGQRPSFLLFVPPIALSAYWGGTGPGLAATAFSAFGIDYYLARLHGGGVVPAGDDAMHWVLFGLAGCLISLLSGRLHRKCNQAAEIATVTATAAEAHQRYRTTLDGLMEGGQLLGFDWTYLYLNPAAAIHNRRPNAELLGRTMPEMWPGIEATPVFAMLQSSMKERTPLTSEVDFHFPDGHHGTFEIRSNPVPEGIFVLSIDITARRKAAVALQAAEEQALRAQRLEAIGTLSSGIAHDLNNTLAPILMLTPSLAPKLSDPTDLELLQLVEQSAQRGAGIIRQLLTFSRGVVGERRPVQVGVLLGEVLAILRQTFPREIAVEAGWAPDIWTIVGDATQLHQVILNLCINARDAMPNGGRLSLSAKNATFSDEEIRTCPQARPGRFVALGVSDSGSGIPAALRSRIFEPFFTTKAIGQGTGLGLSTALGIVKSHQGFILVESGPGQGSAFTVCLPAVPEADIAPAETGIQARRGQGETILVVDDEPAVRQSVAQMLGRNGYRCLQAADGQEALRLYREHRSSVRLVVTDIMMPEMGGAALARELRLHDSALPIVGISGLHDDVRSQKLMEAGVKRFLAKPFTASDLLIAVQDSFGR